MAEADGGSNASAGEGDAFVTHVTRDEKLRIEAAWATREAKPQEAAKILHGFAHKFSLTAADLASLLGASAAEILVFLLFADLEEPLQAKVLARGFSSALIARVVDLEPEEQAAFLSRVLAEGDQLDAARAIVSENRKKQLEWMNALTGQQIMHLSAKARGYDAFTDRRRSALLKFGRLLKAGYSLSVAQVQFLRAMLDELDELGVVNGECFEPACSTCKNILRVRATPP